MLQTGVAYYEHVGGLRVDLLDRPFSVPNNNVGPNVLLLLGI